MQSAQRQPTARHQPAITFAKLHLLPKWIQSGKWVEKLSNFAKEFVCNFAINGSHKAALFTFGG